MSRASTLRRGGHLVAIAALVATSVPVAGLALVSGAAGRAAAEPRLYYSGTAAPAISGATSKRKSTAAKPDIATGPDNLQLLSQTAWVRRARQSSSSA